MSKAKKDKAKKMKGEWKIASSIIDGEQVYAIYRLADGSNNREWGSCWLESIEEAEEWIAAKNKGGK